MFPLTLVRGSIDEVIPTFKGNIALSLKPNDAIEKLKPSKIKGVIMIEFPDPDC